MKHDDLIRKVAAKARRETPPQADVTDRVMAALRTAPSNGRTLADPLAWVAGASAVAAVAVVAVALRLGDTWTDVFVASRIDLPWWLL